jgi:surfeit locus 1 family protein
VKDAAPLFRALVSRRWVLVTLGVLLLMGVLARLGVWQLDRLEERRAANAALVAALDSPPIDLNAEAASLLTAGEPQALETLRDRDAQVHGRYDTEHSFIVKLQTYQDRPGVKLVTPLVIDDQARPVAVLVDRGWISDDDLAGAGLAGFAPEPEADVRGYIALTETLQRAQSPTSISGNEVYRVDVAAIEKQLPYPLLPFYVKDAPPDGGDVAPPFREAREVDLSEGPHLSYAMQWFIFSLGLGTGYVVFVWRKESAERETRVLSDGRMKQV